MRFKEERDKKLIFDMNPVFLGVFFGIALPLIKRDYPDYEVTVTRTIDDKIEGESVSNTHAEGRALDIRIYDMKEGQAKSITSTLNLVLADMFGAISIKDGCKRFAVLEDDHIHLQCASFKELDMIKLLNNELYSKYGII